MLTFGVVPVNVCVTYTLHPNLSNAFRACYNVSLEFFSVCATFSHDFSTMLSGGLHEVRSTQLDLFGDILTSARWLLGMIVSFKVWLAAWIVLCADEEGGGEETLPKGEETIWHLLFALSFLPPPRYYRVVFVQDPRGPHLSSRMLAPPWEQLFLHAGGGAILQRTAEYPP